MQVSFAVNENKMSKVKIHPGKLCFRWTVLHKLKEIKTGRLEGKQKQLKTMILANFPL